MENKHTFGFSPCPVKASDEAEKAEKKKGRKKDNAAVAPAHPEVDNAAAAEQETGDILAQ